jgi:hypothetical protein
MSDDDEEPIVGPVRVLTTADFLQILAQQSQAGNVLVTTGLIEDELEKLLLTAGRELTGGQAKDLFRRGALRNFAGKIDIAYLFELIDDRVQSDLHVIRAIRNNFAHTTQFVHFDSPHVNRDCRRLSNWSADLSNEEAFRRCSLAHVNTIRLKLEQLLFARALKNPPEIVEE